MSEQNGGNGNGHKPGHASAERTALDKVTTRLEQQQAEEASSGVIEVGDDLIDPHEWKTIVEGAPLTIEVLHRGLISVSQTADAAIEAGIHIAGDLKKMAPAIERTAIQVATTAAKVEATATHVHQVEDEVSKLNKTVERIRKDVQFIKDTVAEMQDPVRQIPAIKELLGEILVRLPEPRPKRRKSKKNGAV